MIIFEPRAGESGTDFNNDKLNTEALELSKKTGLRELACKLLVSRGIKTPEEALDFLDPLSFNLYDPYLFQDMDKAVERLDRALKGSERICVFGDYDVDGICATSMLYLYLSFLGADVFYHIPSRKSEGYGLTTAGIKKVHERGAKLLITVDNGIVSASEISYAKSLGIDAIITDHHRSGNGMPECSAVICHSRPDNTYPNTDLCGAGTALKLITAHGGENVAREFIPFAGFATVSDVVPLHGENRAIVAMALSMLNSGERPVGINALCRAAGVEDRELTAYDFAFKLGPRLNAAGRLEDASLGVELLCSQSMERAQIIADKLNELNEERRQLESTMITQAREMLDHEDIADNKIIMLASDEWHPGVVGIAASRICEEYYRPTILFHKNGDTLTGSARSIPGVDIHAFLSRFSEYYERFGGHSMAAGLTINQKNYEELRGKANECARELFSNELYIPRRIYDMEVDFQDLSLDFVNELKRFAPFGEGNPKPLFLTRGVRVPEVRVIGKQAEHLSGKASDKKRTLSWVAFYRSQDFDRLLSADRVDILYSPDVNEWGGMSSVQLGLKDFKASFDAGSFVSYHKQAFSKVFYDNLILREDLNADNYDKLNTVVADREAKLLELLNDNIAGNMVLCFTPEGATEALNIIVKNDLNADIALFKPESPRQAYNSLVLAPKIRELSEYARHIKKVFVFDGLYDDEALKALCRALPNAQIALSEEFSGSLIPDEFITHTDRDSMGKLYREALVFLRSSPIYSDDCAEIISGSTGLSLELSNFAINVFLELGFFRLDANGRLHILHDPPKRPLTDSALYTRLITHERYIRALQK